MIRRLGLLLLVLASPASGSAGAPAIEAVRFDVAEAFERGAAVTGELRIPQGATGRLPAVLILHGSAGIDGRGAFYAEALNAAGIATLEIDMFQGRGRPATTRHNMPHAFQSLGLLASHPRIDGARVGVMGFSWGGAMALLSSSEEVAQRHGGKLRFAAHLPIYPVCWTQHGVLDGNNRNYPASTYRRLTGAPVHILAGDKDEYDDPDGCSRFVAALPAGVREHVSLTYYRGGTHGWDSRAGGAYHDTLARKGDGGHVRVVADPELAARSRAFAVDYFRKHLRP